MVTSRAEIFRSACNNMALLIDLFGFISVLLSGAVRTAQCLSIGTVLFLLFIFLPTFKNRPALEMQARIFRIGFLCSFVLTVLLAFWTFLHIIILFGSLGLSLGDSISDDFAGILMLRILFGAFLCMTFRKGKVTWWLAFFALGDLLCGVATSHAAARLDHRLLLLLISALHHLGAAVWIGGLPAFIASLRRTSPDMVPILGRKYSHLSMAAVSTIFASGVGMGIFYVGSIDAIYGTAYGVMMSTKSILFSSLLLLGLGNFLLVRRLSSNKNLSFTRLIHFAEVELGIGVAVFFAAASMTSLPPAIDLTAERASLTEITARMIPHWPSLVSPQKDALSIYEVQRQLDLEAAKSGTVAAEAYVPGSGIPAPRNAADIKWSEYNHHWSGIIVMLVGFLALVDKGWASRYSRHWPLAFLLLALFLFFRSEAEFWPIGTLSLAESIRDPEFIQHKIFILLIAGLALCEWAVRTNRIEAGWAPYVFPLTCAGAGTLLLTHSHSLSNVKELLLIEFTHVPLALFGIWAGWARWLDLRLPQAERKGAGWVWPVLFCLVGLSLFLYREI